MNQRVYDCQRALHTPLRSSEAGTVVLVARITLLIIIFLRIASRGHCGSFIPKPESDTLEICPWSHAHSRFSSGVCMYRILGTM